MSSSKSCENCGAGLNAGWTACARCGREVAAEQPAFCASCGSELPSGARYCPECSTMVAPATPAVVAGDGGALDPALRNESVIARPGSASAGRVIAGVLVWPLGIWWILQSRGWFPRVIAAVAVAAVWAPLAFLAVVFGLVGVLTVLLSTDDSPSSGGSTSAVESMTPLEQMEIAFVGGYSEEEIKPLLDEVLRLYNWSTDDQSRRRAGNILVTLRRETGVGEMRILDYMRRSYTPAVSFEFDEAAGLSVAFIQAGDE